MTGPALASVLGDFLQECRRTGYYPPPAIACADEHPISGALCKRIGCDGDHDYDGLPPWTDTEENDR